MLKVGRLGSSIFVFAGKDYAVYHCNTKLGAIVKCGLIQLLLYNK